MNPYTENVDPAVWVDVVDVFDDGDDAEAATIAPTEEALLDRCQFLRQCSTTVRDFASGSPLIEIDGGVVGSTPQVLNYVDIPFAVEADLDFVTASATVVVGTAVDGYSGYVQLYIFQVTGAGVGTSLAVAESLVGILGPAGTKTLHCQMHALISAADGFSDGTFRIIAKAFVAGGPDVLEVGSCSLHVRLEKGGS